MSATNRGATRNERDFYATPKEAFEPLLPYLWRTTEAWRDPACGDQRLIRWMTDYNLHASGADLLQGYDFLQDDNIYPGGIVTNPPFSLALEFCDHAIKHTEHVFMLLRLNFLASEGRWEWWVKHKPDALFVLSKRPSFVHSYRCWTADCKSQWSVPPETPRIKNCPECGSPALTRSVSDACDYGWFYWGRQPAHEGFFFL